MDRRGADTAPFDRAGDIVRVDPARIEPLPGAKRDLDFLHYDSAIVSFARDGSRIRVAVTRNASWLNPEYADHGNVLLARIDHSIEWEWTNAYFPSVDFGSGRIFRVVKVLRGDFPDPFVSCIAHSGIQLQDWVLSGAPEDSLIEMALDWDGEMGLYELSDAHVVADPD